MNQQSRGFEHGDAAFKFDGCAGELRVGEHHRDVTLQEYVVVEFETGAFYAIRKGTVRDRDHSTPAHTLDDQYGGYFKSESEAYQYALVELAESRQRYVDQIAEVDASIAHVHTKLEPVPGKPERNLRRVDTRNPQGDDDG